MQHTVETRQAAIAKLANHTVRKVSDDTGITPQTLYLWIRKFGIDYKIGESKRQPAVDIDDLKSLLKSQSTLTEREIASILDVERSAVTRAIAKLQAVKVWSIPNTYTQRKHIRDAATPRERERIEKLYQIVKKRRYKHVKDIAADMDMHRERIYQLCRDVEIQKMWCFQKRSEKDILKSLKDNPDWTLQMHADRFGCTRQYVHFIKQKQERNGE